MEEKKKDDGVIINPTYNFDLLKDHRKTLYQVKEEAFVKEREDRGLQTTSSDLEFCYKEWLKNELRVIEQWLSDVYPNGEKKRIKNTTSNQLEIFKYKRFIEEQIEKDKQDHTEFKQIGKTTVSNHPEFNPNLWNKECYGLFKFLFDKYYKGTTKRRLTNIWFYLHEYTGSQYVLKCTKDQYKDFIRIQYKIEIKNFDKASALYTDKEQPTMNDFRISYEK